MILDRNTNSRHCLSMVITQNSNFGDFSSRSNVTNLSCQWACLLRRLLVHGKFCEVDHPSIERTFQLDGKGHNLQTDRFPEDTNKMNLDDCYFLATKNTKPRNYEYQDFWKIYSSEMVNTCTISLVFFQQKHVWYFSQKRRHTTPHKKKKKKGIEFKLITKPSRKFPWLNPLHFWWFWSNCGMSNFHFNLFVCIPKLWQSWPNVISAWVKLLFWTPTSTTLMISLCCKRTNVLILPCVLETQ